MPRSKKELKELRKYALKLSDISWKRRVQTLILLLFGILCVAFIVSTIENFIISHKQLTRESAGEIRVEVLNGTPVKGLAERVAETLRSKGFDVLGFGNADECSTTVIFDRVDIELKNARFVYNALKQGKIRFEVQPLQLVDVTIVLGKDFRESQKTSVVQYK